MNPYLHDGLMVCIDVTVRSSAKIAFHTMDRRAIEMRLEGVRYLRADGFAEGNIVDSLTILGRDQFGEAEILALQPDPQGLHRTHLAQWIEAYRRDNLWFVEILSSYGCELRALYTSVQFVDKGPTAAGDAHPTYAKQP